MTTDTEPMYYTPKPLFDLLQAEAQKAEYLAVMANPPFAVKAKDGKK
jgi:hypothetical protein